jgi:serine/threonine protein kinase
MPLQEGDQIGAYEIVGQLGQGGMATVYKAYHQRLDRFVALKLMHETFLQDDDFRARFQREARIVARLEHPNIVHIYDFNEHEGIPYLVMKFVPGMTLKKYAIKNGLTLQQTRDFLMQIAEALDYAHTRGVLHRDMKPSNILIDKTDCPYITDFGLARIAEAGSSTISHDMMLGTPFYISPEQAQGERDLDSRTDIYSLGVILYELVSGRVPFQADTPYAIVHGHIYQQPEAASSHNDSLPEAVDWVLDKALAKEPDDRYDTAVEMMQAFAEAIETGKQQTTPPPRAIQSFNDLGDEFIEASRARRRSKPAAKPRASVPGAAPRRRVEAEFDLGNINFGQLGNNIRTGVTSLAEMIEERIDAELRQRNSGQLTEEEIIRRRVEKKMEARREFVQHLATYLGVNAMLIGIWLFSGAGFFWPFFPLFFWGIGVAGQGAEYYSEYGPGAESREAAIEEEVQRHLQRSQQRRLEQEAPRRKAKSNRAGRRLEDVQRDGGGVRLNEDGELTDSFIEEQQRDR